MRFDTQMLLLSEFQDSAWLFSSRLATFLTCQGDLQVIEKTYHVKFSLRPPLRDGARETSKSLPNEKKTQKVIQSQVYTENCGITFRAEFFSVFSQSLTHWSKNWHMIQLITFGVIKLELYVIYSYFDNFTGPAKKHVILWSEPAF